MRLEFLLLAGQFVDLQGMLSLLETECIDLLTQVLLGLEELGS